MMQGGKDMSKEVLLESIRNYFHVRKGLFSLDIVLADGRKLERYI